MIEIFDLLSIYDKSRREEGETSRHGAEGDNSHTGGCHPPFTNRYVKLDFSRFNGEEDPNPTSWVCRAEQFFRFQGTSEEER